MFKVLVLVSLLSCSAFASHTRYPNLILQGVVNGQTQGVEVSATQVCVDGNTIRSTVPVTLCAHFRFDVDSGFTCDQNTQAYVSAPKIQRMSVCTASELVFEEGFRCTASENVSVDVTSNLSVEEVEFIDNGYEGGFTEKTLSARPYTLANCQ